MKRFASFVAAVLILTALTSCKSTPSEQKSTIPTQSSDSSETDPANTKNEIYFMDGVSFRFPQSEDFYIPDFCKNGSLVFRADYTDHMVLSLCDAYRNLYGLSEDAMAEKIADWYYRMPGETYKLVPLEAQNGIHLHRLEEIRAEGQGETHYFVQKDDIIYDLLLESDGDIFTARKAEQLLKDLEIDSSGLSFNYDPKNDISDDTPYCYGVLSEEDRKIYDEIRAAITPDGVDTGTVWTHPCSTQAESDRIERIVYGIMFDDEPQNNFLGFDIGWEKDEYRVKPVSVMCDHKEDMELRDLVKRKTDEIFEEMPSGLTRYGKYVYLAEVLCKMCRYDYNAADPNLDSSTYLTEYPYGVRGPFEDGAAVCFGYAHAYTLLCNYAGLFCNTISAGEHAWNMIRLNGEYYYFDTTWMDTDTDLYGNAYLHPFGCDDPDHKEYLQSPRCAPFMYDDYTKILYQTGELDWQKEARPFLCDIIPIE